MIAFREEVKIFDSYNAVAIGPGIGTDKSAEKLLKLVLEDVKFPVVFDADALNIIAKNNDWFAKLPKNSVLTPHPKEFDRLFGNHDSEAARRQTTIAKAAE